MVSQAPSAPAASAEASAAAASPPGTSIALKIRTLDQKTYPIVVRTDASVPQLKEAVASETGVVLARQRLIFRGKVLKNDQSIASYALEDGHVLHLVVRAEEAVAAEAEQQQQQQHARDQGRFDTRRHQATATTRPRNNDEPDPTIGASPRNRVVMGATIAVPDDMPMPFLNSVIANFVSSMGSAAAAGAGMPGEDTQRTQRNRDMLRRLRRSRHAAEAGPGVGGSRRRGRDGAEGGVSNESTSLASSLSGNMLRDSVETQLHRLETSLSNTAFDLPEIQRREEGPNSATHHRDEELVRTQLTQLRAFIERFGPRMDRLPDALQEIGWYARQNEEAPNAIVSSTVRAIDTLQNVGDSASAIARFARHVFLANSPTIPSPTVRFDDRGMLRASLTIPVSGPPSPSPGPFPEGALPRLRAQRQQTGMASMAGPTTATGNSQEQTESPGVLRSLYQRVTSGLLGSRNSDQRSSTEAATSTPPRSVGSPAILHPDEDGMNRFTISAVSGPFHPVFPMSFSGGGSLFPPSDRSTRPEWDVAGLWQRLVRDLRAGTVFGILRGDPVALYELMRSLATIFVAGAYTPSLTSTPIRVWARRFLIAVRRELNVQNIPSEVLDLTPDRNVTRLVEEFTRPFDPFMPELVDHIRRANTASQGDVFGRSCVEFLRNMAVQFVGRMRTYVDGDDTQVARLLETILTSLDVEPGLAAFVIAKLFEFVAPRPRRARAVEDAAAPEPKRRRRE